LGSRLPLSWNQESGRILHSSFGSLLQSLTEQTPVEAQGWRVEAADPT